VEDTTQFASTFNLSEATLWLMIAAIIAWKLRKRKQIARFYWLLPPTFAVFGISDFIEARTGAFWEPWWLLVMKTGCVVLFVIVGILHRRNMHRSAHGSSANTSTSTPLDPRT
jgi:hypothetical protein